MKTRSRTEITIEMEETITFQRNANLPRELCPDCGTLSFLITPCQAVALLEEDIRAVCRAIDSGHLHTVKTATGSLLICLKSLREAAPHLKSHSSKLQINEIIKESHS